MQEKEKQAMGAPNQFLRCVDARALFVAEAASNHAHGTMRLYVGFKLRALGHLAPSSAPPARQRHTTCRSQWELI